MQMIIFAGIQGSGKSTFYKEKFFNTHIRINLDMLKTRHREKIILQACIAGKQPCVIDNTNPTRADRAKYIDVARAAKFQLIGYWFNSTVEDALNRNCARVGKARIPDIAIISTFKKFEPLDFGEGFEEIYRVQLVEAQGFLIERLSRHF
jgi:predicted kinase